MTGAFLLTRSSAGSLRTLCYNGEELKLACGITAEYSDGAGKATVRVCCEKDGELSEIPVEPLKREAISRWLI